MTGPVTRCQVCQHTTLELVIALGNLAPCNDLRPIDEPPREQATYPTDLYFCEKCQTGQLGYVPPQDVTFPSDYPYRSGMTRALRENFAELAAEVTREVDGLMKLGPDDLVIDIGGNDGTLLSNFAPHCRTLNVTPEDMGARGADRGIQHHQSYWSEATAVDVVAALGQAKLVTATNVFAHVTDPADFLRGVTTALAPGGLLVIESQYFGDLIADVQFDHCYGEHARFLTLASIDYQLRESGMKRIGSRRTPTHGGSARVYAARSDDYSRSYPYGTFYNRLFEDASLHFPTFRTKVEASRRELRSLLCDIRRLDLTVAGLGAPSRAGTLIGYCGLDVEDIAYIAEAPGSYKVGRFMAGTRIPIVEEGSREAPALYLVLAHHVAGDLMRGARERGFKGKFILPIPEVRVVE